MKRHYLLLVFLGITSLATAQRNPEFGFIAKAGNFGFPGKNTPLSFYSDNQINTVSYNPGSLYALGIWHSWPVGKQFRISGQVLYRSTSFDNKDYWETTFQNGGVTLKSISDQRQRISESSLSIPVALHYNFKKLEKLSIYLGGGVSRLFSSRIRSEILSSFTGSPSNTQTLRYDYSNWDDFSMQLNLNAGVFYQLDPQTSIGVDYTFEKLDQLYFAGRLILANPAIDCICFPFNQEFRPNMKSFSVSLRHNILD